MESVQSLAPKTIFFDPRDLTTAVSPGLPGIATIGTPTMEPTYDVFQVGAGALDAPGAAPPGSSSASKQAPSSEDLDPSKRYWYPIEFETMQLLSPEGDYAFAELPERAQLENPLGSQVVRVMRGTLATRWILLGPDNAAYIWANMAQLENIASKIQAMQQEVIPEEDLYLYPEEPVMGGIPTWMKIALVGTGAVSLVFLISLARRK